MKKQERRVYDEAIDTLITIAEYLNCGGRVYPDSLVGEGDETAKDRVNRVLGMAGVWKTKGEILKEAK